ncbi:uncharacterized protein LOC122517905 [Polistes fuscatus]|uniref:uncharacterized protein LOC122517905 n=1 Tax=Polistes fuscatus TaxID=30207 RepID=UPI001CA7BCF3|nr:uncharacterized protein LOC122517905 [Polistes fuscatus]
MTSVNAIVFILLTLTASSLQRPTFFKNTFKGLRGISTNVNLLKYVRAVYYHEQTVAIVDLGLNNELHDCNIVEVYEPEEAIEVLRNLSLTSNPQRVSFEQIMKLLEQCETLDSIQTQDLLDTSEDTISFALNIYFLFFTFCQGTKWCGAGDIADNYHDLGREANIDRCCRNHDLCPVKVRARTSRFNLNNNSLYTKSHCTCDELFYNCLKNSKNSIADLLGNIYFNIIRVPCIEDISSQWNQESKKQFVSVKMKY